MHTLSTAGRLACAFGRGIFAGLAGTATLTASMMLEAKLRKQPLGTTPADVAEKALGFKATGDRAKQRLSRLIHWGYGALWGGVRGLIDEAGLRGNAANTVHAGVVYGVALVMLPKAEAMPPLRKWGAGRILTLAGHHLLFAFVTGAAYDAMTPAPRRRRAFPAALAAIPFGLRRGYGKLPRGVRKGLEKVPNGVRRGLVTLPANLRNGVGSLRHRLAVGLEPPRTRRGVFPALRAAF